MPLWTSLAYSVNAFTLWGGGYWAQQGAGDFSGGYVIHLAAGTSGFVAAAIDRSTPQAGPREGVAPQPCRSSAIGAASCGWAGTASTVAIRTSPCRCGRRRHQYQHGYGRCALLTWVILGHVPRARPRSRPHPWGPSTGWSSAWWPLRRAPVTSTVPGALLVGAIDSTIVWFAWTYLSRASFMKKVDDAMGIIYTHGIAGFFGGLLLGVFADPSVVEYTGASEVRRSLITEKGASLRSPRAGAAHPVLGAAITVIIWDALVTFVILTVITAVNAVASPQEVRRLRSCEIGDLAAHDEEGYPDTEGATRVLSGYGEEREPATASVTTAPSVVGGGA